MPEQDEDASGFAAAMVTINDMALTAIEAATGVKKAMEEAGWSAGTAEMYAAHHLGHMLSIVYRGLASGTGESS